MPATARDVEHLQARIADGLADDEPGSRFDGGGEASVIAGIDQRRANAEPRQRLHQEIDGAAIERRRRDDVVARARERRDRQMQGRHPARGADRADAALERGDAFLQYRRGRIGDARIEMAGAFEIEERRRVVGVPEDVGGGLVDRHGAGAGDGIGMLPRVQAQRVEGGRTGSGHEGSLPCRNEAATL